MYVITGIGVRGINPKRHIKCFIDVIFLFESIYRKEKTRHHQISAYFMDGFLHTLPHIRLRLIKASFGLSHPKVIKVIFIEPKILQILFKYFSYELFSAK